jgi:small basic protein
VIARIILVALFIGVWFTLTPAGYKMPYGFLIALIAEMALLLTCLAALDSVLGAVKAWLNGNFENKVFISGLLVNSLAAGALTYLGDKLGVELYFAAIVAFGVRIFDNLAVIRRHLL